MPSSIRYKNEEFKFGLDDSSTKVNPEDEENIIN